jgi:hypothetical protein
MERQKKGMVRAVPVSVSIALITQIPNNCTFIGQAVRVLLGNFLATLQGHLTHFLLLSSCNSTKKCLFLGEEN